MNDDDDWDDGENDFGGEKRAKEYASCAASRALRTISGYAAVEHAFLAAEYAASAAWHAADGNE